SCVSLAQAAVPRPAPVAGRAARTSSSLLLWRRPQQRPPRRRARSYANANACNLLQVTRQLLPRTWRQRGTGMDRCGSGQGLSRPLAQIGDQALLAKRTPRHAYIAPVQNKPVVRMALVSGRHDLIELAFHFERRRPRRKTSAIANTKDVGVNRNCRLAERHVENHICGFATHPRQCFERLTRARHLTPMLLQQLTGQANDVLRLGPKQPDGLDQVLHPLLAESKHLRRRVSSGK